MVTVFNLIFFIEGAIHYTLLVPMYGTNWHCVTVDNNWQFIKATYKCIINIVQHLPQYQFVWNDSSFHWRDMLSFMVSNSCS